jgi:TolB-like protein
MVFLLHGYCYIIYIIMTMKKTKIALAACMALLVIQLTQTEARQVVTENDRAFARKEIEQEKSQSLAISPNTLAILYFSNKTRKSTLDPLQKGISILLMTDLSQLENIRMVERVKLQALAEELGLGVSGLVDPDTSPRMGRMLGAQYLVGGDILSEYADELDIKSRLLDVKEGQILGQSEARGLVADIFSMEKKILFEIVELLKLELTPSQKIRLEKPLTTNIRALLYFFNGIECSDRGNYREAARYYQKALKEDPQFLVAQDSLNELLNLDLVTLETRSRLLLEELGKRSATENNLDNNPTTDNPKRPGDVQRPGEIGGIRVIW